MSRLTRTQKAVLVRAGMSEKATAKNVGVNTGQALQVRGYGYYMPDKRVFYLNSHGLRFALTGEQIKEEESMKPTFSGRDYAKTPYQGGGRTSPTYGNTGPIVDTTEPCWTCRLGFGLLFGSLLAIGYHFLKGVI